MEPWTTRCDRWPGGRPGHWNHYLEELQKRKRRAYHAYTRNCDPEAGDEHGRLYKLLRKEDRSARRSRAPQDIVTLQSDPLGGKARSIQSDRRGRQRHQEASGRKESQVRPFHFTKFLYESHEQVIFMSNSPGEFTFF